MPKRVWLLIIGMLVNVTGNSFLWPLTTIYMHDYLGKSLSVAGLVLMVNAGAAIIGNLLGGLLFDRIGGYRSIMGGIIVTTLALTGLTVWHDFMQFAVFYTIIGFSGGIVFPSMYAMVGTVWPEGGRKAFNAIYLAQNVGVAIGPALAGFLAAYSFDYIFAANLGMYILFFLIACFGFKSLSISPMSHTSVFNEKKKIRKAAPFYALMIVSIGYLLCWIGYVQWQSTISTYTQEIGITLPQYSLLWTVNGLLIVLGQPFIQPIIKRIEDNIKRQLVIGIIIMMVSYIVVAFAEEFSMFIIAMVILTIGEMFVWPAVPALANQLAPKGREGFYQGIVNSVATSGRMIGPLFGGLMVDLYGMPALFLVITLLVSVSIATSLLYDYPLKRAKKEQLQENYMQ
ncbi:MFS transporter [Planomicrobium sp. CPCC 101079]|uniref:MDR family MFS transporter n=1 Tax=Planomicrobium sp. CPCC 101079 TaxID=2599618 RepID=UPI0011B7BFC5|nr:MFS transporter [Planomicrobium sp. CPCC 101079]TWT12502.1 MFS transporter [Planomicrobium sp. CPCC 101079]